MVMPAATAALPLDPAPAAIRGEPLLHGIRLRRVLLVEDERTNQMIATARLKGLGYEVDIASDGGEAVAAVETRDYDVVLMDLMMPEMDGLEATRLIRSLSPPAGTVPIIALTGSSGDCYVGACLEAGMNDFLSKPFTDAFLAAAIDRALSQRDFASPVGEAVVLDAPVPPPASPPAGPRAGEAGAKRAHDIAEMFLNDAERRLAMMQALLMTGDAAALERAAHSLATAGATFGFHRLAAIAGEIAGGAATARLPHLLELLNEAAGALSIARG
jgi:CheY-like chemotaxis protein/HPt (histidine-containing phosphotransfer) domain-containing protein